MFLRIKSLLSEGIGLWFEALRSDPALKQAFRVDRVTNLAEKVERKADAAVPQGKAYALSAWDRVP